MATKIPRSLFCQLLVDLAKRFSHASRIHPIVDNYLIHKSAQTERALHELGGAHRAPLSASLLPRPQSHGARLARPSCQRHSQSSVQDPLCPTWQLPQVHRRLPMASLRSYASAPSRCLKCSRITIGDLAPLTLGIMIACGTSTPASFDGGGVDAHGVDAHAPDAASLCGSKPELPWWQPSPAISGGIECVSYCNDDRSSQYQCVSGKWTCGAGQIPITDCPCGGGLGLQPTVPCFACDGGSTYSMCDVAKHEVLCPLGTRESPCDAGTKD